MREKRRQFDLVFPPNHQKMFSVESLPSLSFNLPPNAPAQPQEVPRGDRSIVAEKVDDQVAAGGLDEDRHCFLSRRRCRKGRRVRNRGPLERSSFFRVERNSLKKNTQLSFSFSVSGFCSPRALAGKGRRALNSHSCFSRILKESAASAFTRTSYFFIPRRHSAALFFLSSLPDFQ